MCINTSSARRGHDRNSTENAIIQQATQTYGLSRSPILANFQNVPITLPESETGGGGR